MIDRISTGSTPDNAKYVALVKQGAELAHELLLANHRATLIDQRLAAIKARLGRAQALSSEIAALQALALNESRN